MKKCVLFLVFVLLCAAAGGEVRFSGLDLAPDNHLLFRARADLPDFGQYDTLFLSSIPDGGLTQLTFFPERISFLRDSGQLQIQNRFGVFRSDAQLKNITAIDIFPSFVEGSQIGTGKISPILSSPNGKFLLYTRARTDAFGELILYDHARSTETVVSRNFELTLRDPIAKWSPDSKSFVYSTAGAIYYFSINQYNEDRVVAEDFRKVHEGSISAAQWNSRSSLYYITGTLVYRIGSQEFFARSLYSGLLPVGEISGKIPFRFDPNFDSFWISPDGNKILLNKGGRNVFLYYLNTEDFLSTGSPTSLPYLYLPRNTFVKRVVWSSGDMVTLLAQSIERGESKTGLFRLEITEASPPSAFRRLDEEGVTEMRISPDERSIALLKDDRILIYDYARWESVDGIPYVQPLSVLWRSDRELLIAGAYSIKLYNLNINTSKLIALSQPGEYGYTEDSRYITTKIDEGVFRRAPADRGWESVRRLSTRDRRVASSAYRVYLEESTRGSYQNHIMVRNIQGYGTVPLLAPEVVEYEPFPEVEQTVRFDNFTHGSRIRRREVALTFDMVRSIEGLTTILNVLKEYDLECTFFINGEVIRRYPDAVREIAESGHEVGSLFYSHFNMTDSQFPIDKDFIKQGLARTEDDYFAVTGKEVSLMWHAPYYLVSTAIVEASREMNYTYVGRDIDSMDWVTKDTESLTPEIYLPASSLVERILQKKKPGSIIPIRVGVPEGRRRDYLFQKLDLLINGLTRRGYSVVPVSALMEHAK